METHTLHTVSQVGSIFLNFEFARERTNERTIERSLDRGPRHREYATRTNASKGSKPTTHIFFHLVLPRGRREQQQQQHVGFFFPTDDPRIVAARVAQSDDDDVDISFRLEIRVRHGFRGDAPHSVATPCPRWHRHGMRGTAMKSVADTNRQQ